MRIRCLKMLAKPDDTASAVADAVVDAVTDATAEVADTSGDDKGSTKDAEVDLFCRKVADAVTKSIAELLHPSAPPADDEEEVVEAGKKVRRKRKPAEQPKAKKPRFLTLFG